MNGWEKAISGDSILLQDGLMTRVKTVKYQSEANTNLATEGAGANDNVVRSYVGNMSKIENKLPQEAKTPRGDYTVSELTLSGSIREEWHVESISLDTAMSYVQGDQPLAVCRLLTRANQLHGMLHLRQRKDQYQLCLSLKAPSGAWQTGAWLDVSAGDTVEIAWCTDGNGEHISAISMELHPQITH